MKIRTIIATLGAVLAIATGCQKEQQLYLSDVQVSQSYVAVPQDGGSSTITVTSKAAWSISEMPEWLSISPASGNAGETKVTFSAEKTLDGRNCELKLVCGGQTQLINVIQGLSVVSKATCAEVIAGPDSKSYLVTGVVTKIANTSYGNFYLDDGTGEIYIYGTVDNTGAYNWAKFGIEVGDEVTVQGPKSTYNGTVELVDATFVNVNKSLIKVESCEPGDGVIPVDGGVITFRLDNKGKGLKVSVPDDAKSWLSINSIEGNIVRFEAISNPGGDRQVTLTFGTTDGKKDYSCEFTIAQAGRKGTLEIPYTVEEAIAYCNAIGTESANNVYIKGIVSKIANNGEFNEKYGNGTFWISSDGEYHDDLTKDFEAYRVLWLGNEFWKEGNAQITVGAEVIICGKVTLYKGTAETAEKKAFVYSINSVTTDAEGIGTLEAPFTVKGAIAAANNTPGTNDVFVSGKVSKIQSQFTESYGTAIFWLSADGKYNNDKALDFEAYSVYALGNKSWKEGDKTVAEGDDVVLCGQITLYKGTAETNSKKAYVYSINGATE